MEVSYTLWSLKALLDKIPFDEPIDGDALKIDLSKLEVPYFVKHHFNVVFIYSDSALYEASCAIINRPAGNKIVAAIIVKKRYETALAEWLKSRKDVLLADCCQRRELYCHEVCHVIAVIRAFPSDRYSKAFDDFIDKLAGKLTESIKDAQKPKLPSFISKEVEGKSPSTFDKDHFKYDNDSLNYFRLYSELVLDYKRMCDAVPVLGRILLGKHRKFTFTHIIAETLASKEFFQTFPGKEQAIYNLLVEELSSPATSAQTHKTK